MKRKIFFALAQLVAVLSVQAQSISLITPNSGTPGQTTDVMIRGINTHFQSGVSLADFGPDVVVQQLTVLNALTASASIRINANAAQAVHTVKVKTGTEMAELPGGFEIFASTGNFRANIELLPIEAISLSDLDLTNPTTSPVLFFANLYNDAAPKTVTVSVTITAQSRGYIGKLSAKNRALTANQYSRITNRDFTDLDLNGATSTQFLQEVQAIGTFPPDNYTYQLTVKDQNGTVLSTDESTTLITNNKINPELILPGAAFDMPVEDVYNPFPLFQWFGQMDKYDLSLFEWKQGQTAEEVVRTLPVFKKTDITSNNFLYPVYAEKLQAGTTYAWQVLGKVSTSSGTENLPSPVFRFRFNGVGEVNPADIMVSSVTVQPLEIELAPGAQIQFSALVFDKDNTPVTSVTPVWTVSSNKGTVTSSGLFVAGSQPATLAVIVKAGNITEFATVTIKAPIPTINASEWMVDGLMRQLFGLPNQ
jgi:hypothetical protein